MRQRASCDRVRQWASLEVDGELSEFERVMLVRHLSRCDECRTFATDVAAFHRVLTGAPLEVLAHPIQLPSRERVPIFGRVQVLAPAAAAVVALSIALGAWHANAPKTRAALPSAGPAIRTQVPPGQVLSDLELLQPKPAAPETLPGPLKAD